MARERQRANKRLKKERERLERIYDAESQRIESLSYINRRDFTYNSACKLDIQNKIKTKKSKE